LNGYFLENHPVSAEENYIVLEARSFAPLD
jgi:hypothetical protein